jgi:hypothetical protein
MRPVTISPDNQQRLAIGVPIIALLLSLFVVYPTWGRYRTLLEIVQKDRADLAALRAAPNPDVGRNTPAIPGLPSEPPLFLGQLKILAQLSGCRLVNYDNVGTVKQDEGLVRAVRARVDIESRYNGVRAFLRNLAEAPRLYVVTECTVVNKVKAGLPIPPRTIHEDPGLVRATIEIERYVTVHTP